MTYSLKCGNCEFANNVSSNDFVTAWICSNCTNVNTTSLPTSAGAIITNYLLAKSILSPLLEAAAVLAGNIITGLKVK